MNDKILEQEATASRGGGFSPAWGSPSEELPTGVFGTPGSGAPATGYGPPPDGGPLVTSGDTMRVSGSLSAASVLLAILVVAGWFGWQSVHIVTSAIHFDGTRSVRTPIPGWLIPALLGGFVVALVTIRKPRIARFTGPVYSVIEGLAVGAVSHVYEAQYKGIVLQAVGLTVGVFVMMLVLYATKTIRVTDKLRSGVIAATGAVMLVYLATIALRMFGADVPMIHQAGPIGIGFSLLVVGIAAFNLLLDFDFIDRGVRMGAPRYMEWYAGFGLMVALVWLYLELLRLLSKLRSR